MKRIWKQMAGILLALTMVLAAVPAEMTSAAVYYEGIPTEMTVTLYSRKDTAAGTKKNKQYIAGYGKEGKKLKKLKSSDKSVAELSKVTTKYGTSLYVTAKKPGTATLSYKAGAKSYEIKVTVQKYQNPVNSIKIGKKMINGEKFNKRSTCILKYKDFANKKVRINIQLAEGWSFDQKLSMGKYVDALYYFQKGWMKSEDMKNGKSIRVKGGAPFEFGCDVVNDVTGQKEHINVIFR